MRTTRLTDKELSVMELAVAGFSNVEIAERLGVTKGTINKKWPNIYFKLHAANQAQAIFKAVNLGLLGKALVIALSIHIALGTHGPRLPHRPIPRPHSTIPRLNRLKT